MYQSQDEQCKNKIWNVENSFEFLANYLAYSIIRVCKIQKATQKRNVWIQPLWSENRTEQLKNINKKSQNPVRWKLASLYEDLL